MSIVVDVDTYLDSHRLPTIDVRSPGEFSRGHIPGAANVPLFDDAERAEIGTTYKQVGRQAAIALGLEVVGSKANQLVNAVRAITATTESAGPELFLHCWRGGMRSEGVAWLLQQFGWMPQRIDGGYKAFRHAAHESFADHRRIVILGGMTGAGKTRILEELRSCGQQVIDLESLARHRGSAFGGIQQPPQPTVEQFENDLFFQWRDLDPKQVVWLEGESQAIGKIRIPQPVWHQMSTAPAIMVEADRGKRVEFLVQEYGSLAIEELTEAIQRIRKRLGGERVTRATEALQNQDMHEVAEITLQYYDKAYNNSLQKRPRPRMVEMTLAEPGRVDSTQQLIETAEELTAVASL